VFPIESIDKTLSSNRTLVEAYLSRLLVKKIGFFGSARGAPWGIKEKLLG
jgi:hypothetical protein